MAFANSSVYFNSGDGSILGSFRLRDQGYNLFEFSENRDIEQAWGNRFPHKIWVTEPRAGIDQGYRYGEVKKTVAYLAVDEDAFGNPVIEKWYIKNHELYTIPEPA